MAVAHRHRGEVQGARATRAGRRVRRRGVARAALPPHAPQAGGVAQRVAQRRAARRCHKRDRRAAAPPRRAGAARL